MSQHADWTHNIKLDKINNLINISINQSVNHQSINQPPSRVCSAFRLGNNTDVWSASVLSHTKWLWETWWQPVLREVNDREDHDPKLWPLNWSAQTAPPMTSEPEQDPTASQLLLFQPFQEVRHKQPRAGRVSWVCHDTAGEPRDERDYHCGRP